MRRLLAVLTAAVAAGFAAGLAAAAPAADERPVLRSFSARFHPSISATIYTAVVRDPEGRLPAIGFTLRPPAHDPGCRRFEQDPDIPQPDGTAYVQRATWSHGERNGCSHAAEGAWGHDGLVTVRFADRTWTCNATYRGSLTSARTARPHVFCSRIRQP